jgi:hypothetical protein
VLVASSPDDVVRVGVVDSGSPITVADPDFVASTGVDLSRTDPVMEVPLGLGAAFGTVPMYLVTMALISPRGQWEPVTWRALVGSRSPWRYPFSVLFGQRGWFDTFPTTIDGRYSAVDPG